MLSSQAAPRRRRATHLSVLLLAPLLALLAACGSSSDGATTTSSPAGSATASAAAFPVTVTGANGQLRLEKAPQRIVSMSPTATEMLFAVGAGKQVVAVDDNSTYPTDAPKTKLSAFKPNAEAVAGYNPDLVVVSNDADGFVATLEKLKLPTLVLPAAKTLEESYEQIQTIGAATGHAPEATTVVADVKGRIQAAVDAAPKQAEPMKVYHELDQAYYSATSATFIGGIYALFGLENIADKAKDASGGYPQLSAEYVVQAAPDLIVLADTKCCGQTPQTVAKRPAFGSVPAVTQGRVVPVDDDIASRWGPRTADFVEQIAKALQG